MTLGLPTRSSNMSDAFKKGLSIAYGNEYNMPNIVIFSNNRFQWCKKLSFSDPDSHDDIRSKWVTLCKCNRIKWSVLTISVFTGMKESAAYFPRPRPLTVNNPQQKIPFSVLDTGVYD
ncbi:hypothetical protein Egran_05973 [Elaphomyces granulatus]|uniref:Uncharacterized protein n=1 Tax=Elaphomyces granulatus TaxID=519963 RepID=A0A232LQ50_9EURO|nr:hypothetical protein Egran_05973 [Elaphomyces granulatus]